MKGKTSCNVTDCQADFAPLEARGRPPWWNISTRAWYCPHCAMMINRACTDYRDPVICFEAGTPWFTELPQEDKP